MISLGYDLGYYDGYMYKDPPKSPAADYVQGWLQGGSDGLAGLVPEEQFVVDMTIRLLLEQGRCSVNQASMCLYYGPNGARCAAGLWMREGDFNPQKFEGKSITDPAIEDAFPPGFWAKHMSTLMSLQRFHDGMPRNRVWGKTDRALFNEKVGIWKRSRGLRP